MENKIVNTLFFPGHSWEELEEKINWAYNRPDFLFSDIEKQQRQNFRFFLNAVNRAEKVYTDTAKTNEDVEKFPLYNHLLMNNRIFYYPEGCVKSKYQKEVPDIDGIFVREEDMADTDFSSKGLLSFTVDDACKNPDFYKDCGPVSIQMNIKYKPEVLFSKLTHTCNSLIIIDPYAFTKDFIIIDTIKSFLKGNPTNEKFVVTIITSNKAAQIDPKEKEHELHNSIRKACNLDNVFFEIFFSDFLYDSKDKDNQITKKVGTFIHDRYILTDYMMVRFPGGIDSYNGRKGNFRGVKNTSVQIYYPTLHGCDAEKLCEEYWQQVRNAGVCIRMSDGKSENPILNQGLTINQYTEPGYNIHTVEQDDEGQYHCADCIIIQKDFTKPLQDLLGKKIRITKIERNNLPSQRYPFIIKEFMDV